MNLGSRIQANLIIWNLLGLISVPYEQRDVKLGHHFSKMIYVVKCRSASSLTNLFLYPLPPPSLPVSSRNRTHLEHGLARHILTCYVPLAFVLIKN